MEGRAARGPRGGNRAGWMMAQQFGVDADSGLGESWASGCEGRCLCRSMSHCAKSGDVYSTRGGWSDGDGDDGACLGMSAGCFPCRPPERRRTQRLATIVAVGKQTNPHPDVVRLCSIGGVSNAMHMQAGSWRFKVHPNQAQRFRLRPGDGRSQRPET